MTRRPLRYFTYVLPAAIGIFAGALALLPMPSAAQPDNAQPDAARPDAAQSSAGTEPSVTLEQLPCLPTGKHGVVRTRVAPEVTGTEVRLYFRRLHPEVEDFYWVEMEPEGGGSYWVTFPAPADEDIARHDLDRASERQQQENRWAAWWQAKELSNDRDPNGDLDDQVIRQRASEGKTIERDWMRSMELEDLQQWLREQRYEPAEYFAGLVTPDGRLVARSEVLVTPVTNDCDIALNLREQGLANNLVIGETAVWQQEEKEVFHWQCDGIVSRVDLAGILRVDRYCRVCVIAWWQKKSFLIPTLAGVTGVGGIVILDDDEPEPSASEP